MGKENQSNGIIMSNNSRINYDSDTGSDTSVDSVVKADDGSNDEGFPRACLIKRPNSHEFSNRTLFLNKPVKIGRSVARDRALTTNAIFHCKVLSRNHALIWYDNGKFYLQDTKSSNGTFVNNVRLSKGSEESSPREICSGDILQFGVDVVENSRQITHGCIIANVKLYLPDGTEAKASPTVMAMSPNREQYPEEFYMLKMVIKECLLRERHLESKISYLTNLLTETKSASSNAWKSLIEEDQLLSRIEILESQLANCSKNLSEEKQRDEINRLIKEKEEYQTAAKQTVFKISDEKLDYVKKSARLTEKVESLLQQIGIMEKHNDSQMAENLFLNKEITKLKKDLESNGKNRELSDNLIKQLEIANRRIEVLQLKKNMEDNLEQDKESLEKVQGLETEGIKAIKELIQKIGFKKIPETKEVDDEELFDKIDKNLEDIPEDQLREEIEKLEKAKIDYENMVKKAIKLILIELSESLNQNVQINKQFEGNANHLETQSECYAQLLTENTDLKSEIEKVKKQVESNLNDKEKTNRLVEQLELANRRIEVLQLKKNFNDNGETIESCNDKSEQIQHSGMEGIKAIKDLITKLGFSNVLNENSNENDSEHSEKKEDINDIPDENLRNELTKLDKEKSEFQEVVENAINLILTELSDSMSKNFQMNQTLEANELLMDTQKELHGQLKAENQRLTSEVEKLNIIFEAGEKILSEQEDKNKHIIANLSNQLETANKEIDSLKLQVQESKENSPLLNSNSINSYAGIQDEEETTLGSIQMIKELSLSKETAITDENSIPEDKPTENSLSIEEIENINVNQKNCEISELRKQITDLQEENERLVALSLQNCPLPNDESDFNKSQEETNSLLTDDKRLVHLLKVKEKYSEVMERNSHLEDSVVELESKIEGMDLQSQFITLCSILPVVALIVAMIIAYQPFLASIFGTADS